jgi:hypothetical protein
MRVGYAAFLDVLGFSALISSDQGDRVEKYLQRLREVFDSDQASPVDYVVFSDSIILTTPDQSLVALGALLARCSTLLGVMLASDIALCGAMLTVHLLLRKPVAARLWPVRPSSKQFSLRKRKTGLESCWRHPSFSKCQT